MGSGGARARLGAGPRRGAWSRGHTCRLLAPARAGHCPGGRRAGRRAASCRAGGLAELRLLLPLLPDRVCGRCCREPSEDPHSDPARTSSRGSELLTQRASRARTPGLRSRPGSGPTEPRGKGEEAPSSARLPGARPLPSAHPGPPPT